MFIFCSFYVSYSLKSKYFRFINRSLILICKTAYVYNILNFFFCECKISQLNIIQNVCHYNYYATCYNGSLNNCFGKCVYIYFDTEDTEI